MSQRDTRYDCLFEPLAIGPVTAPNRFYQVPHCNGGGYRDPSAVAEMRRIKAEGGWGVIFTEQVELHHSSEITPYIELRLWEDKDVPMLARMADAIHSGNALAGIELAYSGINGPNLYTREIPLAPTALPIRTFTNDPVQARSMTKRDIKNLRRWHRDACLRARDAGYDLICLYGAHGFGVIQHFLSTITNQRTDEFGGSLKNRARLLEELVSEARDAVGDTVGITVRMSLDEANGEYGFSNDDLREMMSLHGDLPDLWDFAHGSWEDCSATSRFKEEAAQEALISGLRELTSKPIVGVGRFTSADTMVRQLKNGLLDFIGCARPSIADPWLPRKIDEGRVEDVRECIGCNICVTGDMTMSLSRCTQNPTFMEEWRKGWHPEIIQQRGTSETVLVVGAGPAGLEATRALGERGYEVVLAEAKMQTGGRVTLESQLPGLSAWARVRDYRDYQIGQMSNVNLYLDNRLTANDILEFGFEHVAVATGAHWRKDAVARYHTHAILNDSSIPTLIPDELMQGAVTPAGKVLIYDDDHYYMGSVLAEQLVASGNEVVLITPASQIAQWTINTLEQEKIQQRLLELGVDMRPNTALLAIKGGKATLSSSLQSEPLQTEIDAAVIVAGRRANDGLWLELLSTTEQWADAGVKSIKCIGDCEAPAPIAWATYAGHRYARELDTDLCGEDSVVPFRRELVQLSDQ